jgi:hypothetical protein
MNETGVRNAGIRESHHLKPQLLSPSFSRGSSRRYGHTAVSSAASPEDEEIERVTASLAERVRKVFERRGLGPGSDPKESDPLARHEPWLAKL